MTAADKLNAETLKAIPLLYGFNATDFSQILDVMEQVTFDPGRLILEQGGTSRDLWILIEGGCEVSRRVDPARSDSKRVVLAMLEPPGQMIQSEQGQCSAEPATLRRGIHPEHVDLTQTCRLPAVVDLGPMEPE